MGIFDLQKKKVSSTMHSLPNCENLKTKTVINFGTAKFSLAYTYTDKQSVKVEIIIVTSPSYNKIQ